MTLTLGERAKVMSDETKERTKKGDQVRIVGDGVEKWLEWWKIVEPVIHKKTEDADEQTPSK